MTNMLMTSPKPTSCHFQRAPVFLPWAEHLRLNHGEPVLAPIKAVEGFVSDFSVSKLSQALMGAGPQTYFTLHLQPEVKKIKIKKQHTKQTIGKDCLTSRQDPELNQVPKATSGSQAIQPYGLQSLQGPKKLFFFFAFVFDQFWECVLKVRLDLPEKLISAYLILSTSLQRVKHFPELNIAACENKHKTCTSVTAITVLLAQTITVEHFDIRL